MRQMSQTSAGIQNQNQTFATHDFDDLYGGHLGDFLDSPNQENTPLDMPRLRRDSV